MAVTPVYDYRISNGSSATVIGSGTISVSFGFAAVLGSGTAFLTQAHVGDLLIVGSQVVGSVKTITDNTHMDLNFAPTVVISGSAYTFDPMVNVETLIAGWPFAPKSIPRLWYQSFDLGDGLKRGMGAPVTSWDFGFVTQKYRDALRVYCPAPAAASNVWIRTRGLDSSDAYQSCSAVMLWPDQEKRDASRRVPFAIDFRYLVIL